jgi:hypothetical protein
MKQRILSITIKDCVVETFTCGGHGGSGKDTSNTGVRIRHLPSGAVGEGRDERYQIINKRRAFKRMAESPKMQKWLKAETARRIGLNLPLPEITSQDLDDMLTPDKLRIEHKINGKWVEESGDQN